MMPNKSYYNRKNMNNMINNAKRQAMEMNKRSTNQHDKAESSSDNGEANKQELPRSSFNLNDLLGNFNLGFTFDEDTLLLAGLIYFLYKQEADSKLLIALLYVLLF